jgi:hypothetical protein
MRVLLSTIVAFGFAVPAFAQTYEEPKPRRQFVTVSVDWMRSTTLDFKRHPLEDLLGRPVATSQLPEWDFETSDGQILIDVVEFKRRTQGLSVAVYPFGLSRGTTLGIRGSIEGVPRTRIAFAGEGAPPPYSLTGATAYDIGAGLFVADRSAGWGLGAMAFVVGGIGRIKADDDRAGTRRFAEGGGGIMFGPFGVQLAAKFAWNTMQDPIEHRFQTIPVTVRGTFSF